LYLKFAHLLESVCFGETGVEFGQTAILRNRDFDMISGDSSGSDFVGMSEISRFKGDSRSPPSTSRHCCAFIPWQLDWEQGRTRLGQKVWHGAVVSRATRFATNLAE
jgi:hypothetical protein